MKTKKTAIKRKAGQPTKLNIKMAEKIFFLGAKGLKDTEIAKIVEIDERTLNRYKKNAEFCQSLKKSKEIIDAQVRSSLLTRALGYDFEEEYPTKDGAVMCKKKMHPDVTACIFWLKNRQPAEWRQNPVEAGDKNETHISVTNIFRSLGKKHLASVSGGRDPLKAAFGEGWIPPNP